jgi:endo-1,4-beta-mannosidase
MLPRAHTKLQTPHGPAAWIGVNYWSKTGGPLMWRSYDPKVVREELDALRRYGMTVTRSFFYWPDFMPTPDSLDENLLGHFQDFLDAHQERDMSSIPTFLVGHMSGQNWDPAWRGDRDLFCDVWLVARQAWYVRELTRRFAAHPAVVAWLLTNEVPIYGDWKSRGNGVLKPEAVASWAQILIDAVRAGGGTQPVSVGEGAWGVEVTGSDNGFRVRDMAALVDFLGPHVYRMETDPVRQFLSAAFVCELLDFRGLPVILEEFGVTSDYTSDDHAAHYYRQVLHHSLLAGASGWLAWNNTDYDDLYTQAPYSHHPFELHFGLIDKLGRAKPAAQEILDFSQLVSDLEIARCSRPPTPVVLLASSYLENLYPFTQPDDATSLVATLRQAYVAARSADLPVKIVREADALLWRPAHPGDLERGTARPGSVYGRTPTSPLALAPGELDPALLGPGLPTNARLILVPSTKQLTAPTWRQLRKLAAEGATVYCSYFVGTHDNQRGPWWPDLDETFGVYKRLRYGLVDPIVENTVVFSFEQEFGGIGRGERMAFSVNGTVNSRCYLPVEPRAARVLARDEHGRPALLEHAVGRGRMILCTYPLEHMAALTPAVNPEATWRLYAALAEVADAVPAVRVLDPRVMVDELVHESGRHFTWCINVSDQTVSVRPEVKRGSLHDRQSQARLETVTLPPFGVRVLERKL